MCPRHGSNRLVPTALLPFVLVIGGLCVATLVILGLLVAHAPQPNWLDTAVASMLRPGAFAGSSHLGFRLGMSAQLGGPVPATFLTALGCYCCLAVRRYRGAVLLATSVATASGLTEYLLKPHLNGNFPSGHATAAFALAAACCVLLIDPPDTRMPASMRAVLAALTLGTACVVALGLVADHFHNFTDTIGGAATGIAITLIVALVIDWAAGRRDRVAFNALPADSSAINNRAP